MDALRTAVVAVLLVAACGRAEADVLIRWDQDRVPAPESLGISTLVVPASNAALAKQATALGYRVYLELDAKAAVALPAPPAGVVGLVVTSKPTAAQLRLLRSRRLRLAIVEPGG